MTESPKAFGLLDIHIMPSPVDQKPIKAAGGGKAGGAQGKKPPPVTGKTPAGGASTGKKAANKGADHSKKASSPAGYQQQERSHSKAKENYPKWRFLTLEEEQRRKRMEFDGYKAEARIRSMAANYDQAIHLYSKALEIEPKDKLCLVARATCHYQVGNFDQAVADAEKAIREDNRMAKAIYVKGEALYQKGEFEMALVCYFRAKKIRPGAPEYDRGIQKAQGAIENCIGELSNTKLERCGDLGYFEEQNRRDEKSTELIVKKGSAATRAQSSLISDNKRSRPKKNAKTVKQMLGELFGDWQYLENILADEEELLEQMREEDVTEETKRRKLLREKREAMRGNNRAAEEDDDKLIPRDTFTTDVKKKKRELSEGVLHMCRKELQYLDERSEFWRQQKSPQTTRKNEKACERRGSVASQASSLPGTPHLLAMLEEIEEDQADGLYEESLKRAEKTLKKVERKSDDEVAKRDEVMATLHSLIGNAHFEMAHYDQALVHYQQDLKIAESSNINEARSRALDNIGRTYARKGRYRDAIKVFEKKIPTLNTPLESTWLYHELGRCHLELNKFAKAKECGEMSLKFAIESDDQPWQLNANVLIAQTEVELENYKEATKAFQDAMVIANRDKDEEAKTAIRKAIEDVNERMERARRLGGIKEDQTDVKDEPPSARKESTEGSDHDLAESDDQNDETRNQGDRNSSQPSHRTSVASGRSTRTSSHLSGKSR